MGEKRNPRYVYEIKFGGPGPSKTWDELIAHVVAHDLDEARELLEYYAKYESNLQLQNVNFLSIINLGAVVAIAGAQS